MYKLYIYTLHIHIYVFMCVYINREGSRERESDFASLKGEKNKSN